MRKGKAGRPFGGGCDPQVSWLRFSVSMIAQSSAEGFAGPRLAGWVGPGVMVDTRSWGLLWCLCVARGHGHELCEAVAVGASGWVLSGHNDWGSS